MLRIDAPHFVAGVIFKDDEAVRAAPIVKYMIGWSRDAVITYCTRKGYHVLNVD